MLSLRRAVRADLEPLLTLVREFCSADGHDFTEPTVRRGLVPLLIDDTHGQVWLLSTTTGAPVGYAVVTWGWSLESGGRESLLDEIYVRSQGTGAGGQLLRHAMTAAAEAGAHTMFLETESHNTRARTFYARHGFTLENSRWMTTTLH